ncbi:MAG: TlpA family protein disulfide reductase [Pirellulales bacterium]|nr:TlpA family protein disulfide reductase [Pirellulales bacterium]
MHEESQPRPAGGLLFWGFIVTVMAMLIVIQRGSKGQMPVPVGTPLPEMLAAGWLNAPTLPSPSALANRIVVVDCWFMDCPPCRTAMPDLAELVATYQPQGVAFVGLTPDSEQELAPLKEFVDSIDGFTWPVGYGAHPTLDMLGIQIYPTVIIFGSGGSAIWSSHRLRGIESVLDRELAALR